jgi:hypothetical protein
MQPQITQKHKTQNNPIQSEHQNRISQLLHHHPSSITLPLLADLISA